MVDSVNNGIPSSIRAQIEATPRLKPAVAKALVKTSPNVALVPIKASNVPQTAKPSSTSLPRGSIVDVLV